MSIEKFIQRMPKVELHVHLEGSIQPETLLALAERNHVTLPAHSVAELRNWYVFKDFSHFVEVYLTICDCVRTPADMELITIDFLKNQARQNIRYSEVIFTPYSHHEHISFADQWTAIQKAHTWAKTNLGITMGLAPDISRQIRPIEHSLLVAEWAVQHKDDGLIALGLGGAEIGNPPELFQEAFDYAYAAGLASAPHAGETEGPASIWGAIKTLHAVRIGHGVRCLEDPELVAYLREHQIPLQVCPSSNVCLGVVPSFKEHPLPKLLAEGLFVSINSDDPPMFNTTLTDEYLRIHQILGFDLPTIEKLVLNGVNASLLPVDVRQSMENEFKSQFNQLRQEFGL